MYFIEQARMVSFTELFSRSGCDNYVFNHVWPVKGCLRAVYSHARQIFTPAERDVEIMQY